MRVNEIFLHTLRKGLKPGHLMTDPADCWLYSYDNSRHHALPEAVVFARETREVQHIVQCCHDFEVPLVARGRGTGTPGGAVPVQGGVVLSLEKMDKTLEINFPDRYIKAEAGVLNQTIQNIAEKSGFFFVPDPGSSAYCTIGGNIGYNAGGPHAVKYGATREHVLGLTAVTGTGEIIHTGTYTTKGAVGYDLTRLLIGSEGTLAIITEAILKLTPLSDFKNTVQITYRDLASAMQAVIKIMSQPYLPSALEFLDESCLKLIQYSHSDAACMLLIDIDDERAKKNIIEASQQVGLIEIHFAENTAEMRRLWAARKALSPALRSLSSKKINEDVVVPVSRVPELLEGLKKLSEKYKIPIVNFGHIGNGNIHVNLLTDSADQCLDEIFNLVISLRGTLSGEHGIGIEKMPFIPRVIDPPTLALMKQIKKVFDPKSILNPGKIFPDEDKL
jgi:D-lactate dehydrogenase (quinone)